MASTQPLQLHLQGGFEAINSALSKVDRKQVKGIGISGQQHGFVPVDRHGQVRLPTFALLCSYSDCLQMPDGVRALQVIRNAKLWCDVESAKEAATLSEQWDYNLVPGFTASKILWLKENEPENFDKLAKVLLPHDYFNWYLTGRYVAEVRSGISAIGCEHLYTKSVVIDSVTAGRGCKRHRTI